MSGPLALLILLAFCSASCPPENLCAECDTATACTSCVSHASISGPNSVCLCDVGFYPNGGSCLGLGSANTFQPFNALLITDESSQQHDFFGGGVAGVGDVNGDGFADVAVSATNPRGDYACAVYVVFGTSNTETIDVSGTFYGFVVYISTSDEPYSECGDSLGAGDFNADGFSDILIGNTAIRVAGGAAAEMGGGGYIVLGAPGSDDVNLLDSPRVVTMAANVTWEDDMGLALVGLGDVNGDAIEDLMMGGENLAYVIFGQLHFPSFLSLWNMSSSEVIVYSGGSRSVAGFGDVNNDGLQDFGIPPLDSDDRVAIIYGSTSLQSQDVMEIYCPYGFHAAIRKDDEATGYMVNRVGDVNGDGIPDMGIWASREFDHYEVDKSYMYILFGSEVCRDTILDDDVAGFVILNATQVSPAADLNGDGYNDILASVDSPWTTLPPYPAAIIWGKNDPVAVDALALGAWGRPVENANTPIVGIATIGDFFGTGITAYVFGDHDFTAAPGAAYIMWPESQPTPTNSPTRSLSSSITPTLSITSSMSRSSSITPQPSVSATASPSASPVPSISASHTKTPTPSQSISESPTPTASVSRSPSPTPTPTSTESPSSSNTESASVTASKTSSVTPSASPSLSATASPVSASSSKSTGASASSSPSATHTPTSSLSRGASASASVSVASFTSSTSASETPRMALVASASPEPLAPLCGALTQLENGRCRPAPSLIIVAVVAAVVVFLALLLALFCYCRYKRALRPKATLDESDASSRHPSREMTEVSSQGSAAWIAARNMSPYEGPRIDTVSGGALSVASSPPSLTATSLFVEGECRPLLNLLAEAARDVVGLFPRVRTNKRRAQTLAARVSRIAEELGRMKFDTLRDGIGPQLQHELVLLRDTFECARAVMISWSDFGTAREVPRRFVGRLSAALGNKYAAEFDGVNSELVARLRELQRLGVVPGEGDEVLDLTVWAAKDALDFEYDKKTLPDHLARMVTTAKDLQDALIANALTMSDIQQALQRNGIDTRQLAAQAAEMTKRERQAHQHMINFSHLEIEEMIGEGSFGTIYKAKWGSMSVAVKCFRCAVLRGHDLRTFEEEASIATLMRHPNIITTYGACFPPDPPCIVMAFAPRCLYDAIRDGISWPDRCGIVLGLASALAFIHERTPPLLHRDIKSRNVLLAGDGTPMLCDFGLAKHKQMMTSAGSAITTREHVTQSVAGTRAWQAPELLRLPQVFSPKSDIYALGMVMYELAFEAVPFWDVVDPDLLREGIASGVRPTIPPIDCGAPEGFLALMQRCWAHSAEERPTAADTMQAIRSIIEDTR